MPGRPAGPRLRFRIVGIVRRPLDLGRKGASGGVVILTPAFYHRYAERIGSFGSYLQVRTRSGTAFLPPFKAAVRRIFGRSPLFGVYSSVTDSGGVQNAIDVLVVALWIIAGVAALAGIVAIGIVLTREISVVSVDQVTLRALGLTRAQRVAMSALPAVVIAGGGALLAVVGAIVASPLFPIGVSRRAEPDLGLHADWAVLALGTVAVAAVVFAIGLLAAFRTTRMLSLDGAGPTRRRASTIPEVAAQMGLAPTATTGLRMALEPGRGRTAVPVRSAFLGALFGVLGVTAVLVFASSLDHLVTTPRLYGWTEDFETAVASGNGNCKGDDFGILKVPGVGAVADVCYNTANIQLDGHPSNGWSITQLRGSIDLDVVAGRTPRGAREVALGSATMKALGKHIGDTVRARGPNAPRNYRIVGQVVFPALGQSQALADGAAFTGEGFSPVFDPNSYFPVFVGRFAPGADRAAVERRIAAIPGLEPPTEPVVPVEVDRLRQIDWVPTVLAALLGGLALLAVGHALVTSVRRRRRDLALLKTLGFNRRQVRATVAWQATTLAAVGLVGGIPAGLIVGTLVWRSIADGLGVSSTPAIPTFALLFAVPAVLALVNLIAFFPARGQRRRELRLRSERSSGLGDAGARGGWAIRNFQMTRLESSLS